MYKNSKLILYFMCIFKKINQQLSCINVNNAVIHKLGNGVIYQCVDICRFIPLKLETTG